MNNAGAQVAQLRRQARLKDLRWGLQWRTETSTAPDFDRRFLPHLGDHYRPRTGRALRQAATIARLTRRADDFVWLRLKDHERDDRQFTQLAAQDLRGRAALQVGLRVLTLRDGRDQHLVRRCHERPHVPFVPKRRTEFPGVGVGRQLLFQIARRRLRRMARRRWRLRQAYDFRL